MAFSSGGGSGPKSDMNVVPLIDVLLVLLIIFMVTAPTPAMRINVTLPQKSERNEPPKTEPPPPLQLQISSAGEITVNNTPQPLPTLQDYFDDITQVRTQVLPVDQQPKLEIEVDPAAEYEVLAKVLARAKNAQFEKIAFIDQSP
ncbi:MAG: ExbD/TolR family protein [Lysobacteraceae bacterium]|jgi:biopolymer transport protein ExbD|nr:biopolymer transporter ExbD [Xanthomonadaceae bacterium]MCZ8319540.1 biopolymer transporter ExbD [Silanimonas sp.]